MVIFEVNGRANTSYSIVLFGNFIMAANLNHLKTFIT